MGEFDRAVRHSRRRLACPRCEAENDPRKSDVITVDARGEANCSQCSFTWKIPIQDLAVT